MFVCLKMKHLKIACKESGMKVVVPSTPTRRKVSPSSPETSPDTSPDISPIRGAGSVKGLVKKAVEKAVKKAIFQDVPVPVDTQKMQKKKVMTKSVVILCLRHLCSNNFAPLIGYAGQAEEEGKGKGKRN